MQGSKQEIHAGIRAFLRRVEVKDPFGVREGRSKRRRGTKDGETLTFRVIMARKMIPKL